MRFFVLFIFLIGCASGVVDENEKEVGWGLPPPPRLEKTAKTFSFTYDIASAVSDVIAASLEGRDIYPALKKTLLSQKMPAPLLLSVYPLKGKPRRFLLSGTSYKEAILKAIFQIKPLRYRCFRLDQVVRMLPPAEAAATAERLRHGLDAIKIIRHNGTEDFLFPDEIVSQDMHDVSKWQIFLSVKYSDAMFVVARVVSWLRFDDGRLIRLERLRQVVRSVGLPVMKEAISAAADYLIRNQNSDGSFLYLYHAGSDKEVEGGYLIRQAYVAAVLLRYGQVFNDERALEAAERAIEFLLKKCAKFGNALWLREPSSTLARLGPSAVLLLALSLHHKVTGKTVYMKEVRALANFILRMQRSDGSFNTYLDVRSGLALRRRHKFYSGEAVCALAAAGITFGEKVWLDAAVKGMHALFSERMRDPYYVWIDAWLMKSAAMLTEHLTEKELRFCYRSGDKVVASQSRLLRSGYADYHGALRLYRGMPSCASDAAFGEGVAALFLIARKKDDAGRAAKYAAALKHLAAFLIRHQFTKINSHFLTNPQKAYGGFSMTLFDTVIRCDVVAHVIDTLLNALALF